MRTIQFPIPNHPIPYEKCHDADGGLIILPIDDHGRTLVDGEPWPNFLKGTVDVEDDATDEEILEIIKLLPYGLCNNCHELAAGSVGGLCDECRPLQVEAIMEKIANERNHS